MVTPNLRRRFRRVAAWLAAGAIVLGAGYAALLRWPERVFPYCCNEQNLALFSDEPIETSGAREVLARVQRKLAASPLYDARQEFGIFVCNTAWRRRLFFLVAPRAGGAHYFALPKVFLSGADFSARRLIAPSGVLVRDERMLDYFIAHEIAHHCTGTATGWIAYYWLPDWIREGYADYVGRGSVVARPGAHAAFLAEVPEMNWPADAPYVRYNLLVGHFLEEKHWPLAHLLECGLTRAEAEVRTRAAWMSEPGDADT